MDKVASELDQLKIDRSADEDPARLSLWVGIPLILELVAAGFAWWRQPQPVLVTTVPARQVRQSVAATVLNASGYVTARRQATVSSKVTGKVVLIP